jgi:hypothetical protein
MAIYDPNSNQHSDGSDSEVSVSAKTFTVSLTFTDMTAFNPLDAAKKACKWLLEDEDARSMTYDVTDEVTNQKYTVDLSEEDEDAVLETE